MSSSQFSWLCPKCGRRVPNRAEICRCGEPRVEATPLEADSSQPDAPSAKPKGPSSLLAWTIVGVVSIAAVGTVIGLQVGALLAGVIGLRLGPGVPDPALLHPRPLEIVPARRGRLRQVLAWVGLAAVLVLGGAGAAWWFLLR